MASLDRADVIAGATETLLRFPEIEARIDASGVATCVTSAWEDAPHPLVYLFWVASSDLVGREAAEAVLGSLDLMLRLLTRTDVVSGAWQSRVKRLFPPRGGGNFRDHYANFQSALFELVMAFRLLTTGSRVTLAGERDTSICDLGWLADDAALAAVEAYAPRKWADRVYEDAVAGPWTALVTGKEAPAVAPEEAFKDITVNREAVGEALARVLTDGNFAAKAKQLGAGSAPTLLAIRGYGLTQEIHEALAPRPPLQMAEAIGADAWSRLPDQCKGLLLSYLGDVLKVEGRSSPVVFIPAPGKTIRSELWSHLDAADMLANDVHAHRNDLVEGD